MMMITTFNEEIRLEGVKDLGMREIELGSLWDKREEMDNHHFSVGEVRKGKMGPSHEHFSPLMLLNFSCDGEHLSAVDRAGERVRG